MEVHSDRYRSACLYAHGKLQANETSDSLHMASVRCKVLAEHIGVATEQRVNLLMYTFER
jgi:hypothetical protein